METKSCPHCKHGRFARNDNKPPHITLDERWTCLDCGFDRWIGGRFDDGSPLPQQPAVALPHDNEAA